MRVRKALACMSGLLVWTAAPAGVSPHPVLTLSWEQLLPIDERGHYDPTPPPPIHGYLGEGAPAAIQTGSYHVNPKLNGSWVRIPGFVVPLEMNPNGTVRKFLLVPYFGACIHVPPPPPNQIVYVTMVAGKGPTSMSDAEWVIGKLTAKVERSELASTAYTLEAVRIEPYKYQIQ